MAERAQQVGHGEMDTSARTVMVVDDLEAIQVIVREMLEECGFHVLTAADAADAMLTAKRFLGQIDVLVTDVQMPGADGIALAREMKASRPGMAIVVMSAALSPTITKKHVASVDAAFLWKPFTKTELLLKIEESLGRAMGKTRRQV